MTQEPLEHNNELPQVVQNVDAAQLQQFVTTIKSAEQQVGENIIRALKHDGTVAVLTTVILGPDGQQRVISAALNPSMMTQVQEALQTAMEEREEEEPCIGFHCLIKLKNGDVQAEDKARAEDKTGNQENDDEDDSAEVKK